jgi:hypothetical protein
MKDSAIIRVSDHITYTWAFTFEAEWALRAGREKFIKEMTERLDRRAEQLWDSIELVK